MFKLTDLNGDGFITVDEFVKVDQIVNATAAKEAEKKFNMVGEMTVSRTEYSFVVLMSSYALMHTNAHHHGQRGGTNKRSNE